MSSQSSPTEFKLSRATLSITRENVRTHDADGCSVIRDEKTFTLPVGLDFIDAIQSCYKSNTWYPKPPSHIQPPSPTRNDQQPSPPHLCESQKFDFLLHLADALYQPFRKLVPFSLLIDMGWLSTLLDVYPFAPSIFLKTEMEFLSISSAGHPQPNQVIFFTMLEIIRLLIQKCPDDIQWRSFDLYLADRVVGWRQDVHHSKPVTETYICKLTTYIRTELSEASLTRSLSHLDEWADALSISLHRSRPRVYLPSRDRLEIYYLIMSSTTDGSHFDAIDQIETSYLPNVRLDGKVTGLHLLQKLIYLARQFSFILLSSVERRKNKSRTAGFLEELSSLGETSVDAWSRVGPRGTSATEIFRILRMMDRIDNRLRKAGFKDGVFFKAKVKIMRWCCLQEWFQVSVAKLHPEWLEGTDGFVEK